jgi:MoxR-like ATPase
MAQTPKPEGTSPLVDAALATLPTCRICGAQDHWLGDHLAESHGISVDEYLAAYPGSPTASQDLMDAFEASQGSRVRRVPPPDVGELAVAIYKMPISVNHDVPEDACLPLPPAYRWPEHGKLSKDMQEVVISVSCGRATWIHGLPGSGKDAGIHAYSWITRTPGLIFNVEPSADIREWFFVRAFNSEGTFWEEGVLLKALRDGYTCPTTGRVIPYIILITDFDRATKAQAEAMRLVMDSIAGRVKGPGGVTYKVLPGTRIVVTANTAGGGDSRGRMVSSNVIDASILDRFERKFEFHWLDWRDEEPIVREKHPLLVERCPEVFGMVGKATSALRQAIHNEDLYAEFSHRAVCSWLGHAQDIVQVTGKVPANLLKRAARAFLDGMPDEETRTIAKRLIDPHLKGGALDHGDTSHIRDESLEDGWS